MSENFEKAYLFFESAVEKESYTPIEIGGLVQAFEFTFELGWKTVKDYLEEQGIVTRFPREAIKEGFNFRSQKVSPDRTGHHFRLKG
jgi:nucleotidyltransferase substrate binding protein (TIGR01987 family)